MKKIIFICTGNTCRSPMAEGYLKSLKLMGIKALSRGLFADGSPVSENAAAVMRDIGIDICTHASKNISADDLDADLFVCMSSSHADALYKAGINKEKITVFERPVPDPFGLGKNEYALCRDSIIDGVNTLLFGGKILPFEIVNADKGDISDIAELERAVFSEPWSENAIKESMEHSTAFFAAKQNGRFLGYIGLNAVADEGYITNVAVRENARNSGIGTLLILRAITQAKEKKLSFISLEVRKSNKNAIKLYEKLEFLQVGTRKNFYRLPNEDAIIMTRRF